MRWWPERRHGSTRVAGHAFLAWHNSCRMFAYIYYITTAGNSINSQLDRAIGTVRKRQAVRPVHHVQNHICRVTLLQPARRATVLGWLLLYQHRGGWQLLYQYRGVWQLLYQYKGGWQLLYQMPGVASCRVSQLVWSLCHSIRSSLVSERPVFRFSLMIRFCTAPNILFFCRESVPWGHSYMQ
jgi:hypothetical protein